MSRFTRRAHERVPQSRVCHPQDIERLVELLRGQVPAFHVPAVQHDLTDRLPLGQGLLGDLRGLLVADVLVERGDDGGGRLGVLPRPLARVAVTSVVYMLDEQPDQVLNRSRLHL